VCVFASHASSSDDRAWANGDDLDNGGVIDLRGSREITCYLIKPTRHIDVVKIDGMALSVHAREMNCV
jgi:hypothetical protein